MKAIPRLRSLFLRVCSGGAGMRALILTNAAGGINVEYGQGALVILRDHINLQGQNPLTGANDERFGPRFPDMSYTYSKRYREIALEEAQKLSITPREGVYAALAGPSYETPAEIRYLRTIGADLVGMSTVPEAIVARHMGMNVLAISCVTNMAAGILDKALVHEEVLEVGTAGDGAIHRAVAGRAAADRGGVAGHGLDRLMIVDRCVTNAGQICARSLGAKPARPTGADKACLIAVFPRDEYRLRRVYVVRGSKAGLVEREAGSSAGIDVEQRLLQRHIAEGFDEGHFDFAPCDCDFHLIAALIAEFEKIFGADIGDQVAEGAVKGDDFAGQAFVVDGCGFQIEADQLLDRRADLSPVIAPGNVRADRRENIAAMEGGRNFGADHPIRVSDLANGLDAVAIFDHRHKAVVGEHEELAALRFHDHRFARTADGGIDHDDEYCSGRESKGWCRRGSGRHREWKTAVT